MKRIDFSLEKESLIKKQGYLSYLPDFDLGVSRHYRITSVLIRLPEKYRNDEEAVKNLLVDAPNGERILLSELAEIYKSEGPQTIFRENLMRRKIILCKV